MPILNYTTQIAAEKTLAEIQSILIKAKASAIMQEVEEGVIIAISFKAKTKFGDLAYRLPANINQIYNVVVRDRRIPQKLRTKEQAARVAWRIIKDWLSAQLAIIEAEMVTLDQVFLPYMQNGKGQTMYELLEEGRLNNLLTNGGEK